MWSLGSRGQNYRDLNIYLKYLFALSSFFPLSNCNIDFGEGISFDKVFFHWGFSTKDKICVSLNNEFFPTIDYVHSMKTGKVIISCGKLVSLFQIKYRVILEAS